MESFVAFLRDNWKFLVEIFIPLVSLIVLCFVKKTKITLSSSLWISLTENIPGWIVLAEEQYGASRGKEKLKFVLEKAVYFLADRLGVDSKLILNQYGNEIVDYIELVLLTPQKKGDQ